MKNFKLPKLHPIIWLMIISAFTIYVWGSFPVIVVLYYILFHVDLKESERDKCKENEDESK